MKFVITIQFLLSLNMVFSQTDTSHFLKVHFLYGSKPKRQHKAIESKIFGGLHGGHVSIQVDSADFGFEPTIKRVHIFSRKDRKSAFVYNKVNGARYAPGNKTVTFIIPINEEQYRAVNRIHNCYADTPPYDYAFFGMRCAASTHEILAQIGLLRKKNRFGNIVTTFYPKRLRKRMFKLAERNNYVVLQTVGRSTRKWEKD